MYIYIYVCEYCIVDLKTSLANFIRFLIRNLLMTQQFIIKCFMFIKYVSRMMVQMVETCYDLEINSDRYNRQLIVV
jgi:multisubunit Na+/H+ antiporter MnhE subunit